MSKSVIFIGRDLEKSSGGHIVIQRNIKLLQKIYGADNVEVHLIPVPSARTRIKNMLSGESYGMNSLYKKGIFKSLASRNFDIAFIDSSLFGRLVEEISRKGLKTIVFFHNVEQLYFSGRFEIAKSLPLWLMWKYAKRMERKAVEKGDVLLTLNRRDDMELRELYGRGADFYLPTSFGKRELSVPECSGEPYCLFVGSNFFANQEGIEWFVRRIAPKIPMKTVIVGSVCGYVTELFGGKFPDYIEVKGVVDSLDVYYSNAVAVVSPIFSGSGLKTKSMEALSYGKTLIGTTEAWEGIDCEPADIDCFRCDDEDSFLKALGGVDAGKTQNEKAYAFFNEHYTDEAVYGGFATFLKGNKL